MTRIRFKPALAVAMLLLLLPSRPGVAQPARPLIPEDELAESIFRQGLVAFEEGDYGMAYRRFTLIESLTPVNKKTTAALLMAGKSLYRDDQFGLAIQVLSRLMQEYATSGYVDEARQLIDLCELRSGVARPSQPVSLGIALPLTGNPALTQALFNGIRIAVEEHNRENARYPVRMLFRDTHNRAGVTRQVVSELKAGGADLIIGPLFSEEAIAAAQAAEEARIVLVAPVATDESVSKGRQYVFQANSSLAMHGRLIARLAYENLGLREFGVLSEGRDQDSQRMATGFVEEIRRLGGHVSFSRQVPNVRAWTNITEQIDSLDLASTEGIYIPLSGSDGPRIARQVYDSLTAKNPEVRFLGNKIWNDLDDRNIPDERGPVFTNDFFVDEEKAEVRDFLSRYKALTGDEPRGDERRLAFAGYDVATFVFPLIEMKAETPLQDLIRKSDLFVGLGTRIVFNESNINEGVFFFNYVDGQPVLID